MSGGSGYNPAVASSLWVAKVWAKTIDRLAYNKAVVWPKVLELEQLKQQLNIPTHGNLSPATVADGSDIFEPTFVTATDSDVTVTPTFTNLPVSVDWRIIERMMVDPKDTLKTSIEMALGQAVDQQVTTLFPSLTTNVVNSYAADLDLASILQARSLVLAGAKEYADAGAYEFAYHHKQDDAVMGIGQFTQFYIRGDKQNPAVGGVVGQAYGINFTPTGNILDSGGGYNNAMWIKRAFVISFNQRPTVKLQDHGYATWLLGWTDCGAATLRDQYACLLKSKNT